MLYLWRGTHSILDNNTKHKYKLNSQMKRLPPIIYLVETRRDSSKENDWRWEKRKTKWLCLTAAHTAHSEQNKWTGYLFPLPHAVLAWCYVVITINGWIIIPKVNPTTSYTCLGAPAALYLLYWSLIHTVSKAK